MKRWLILALLLSLARAQSLQWSAVPPPGWHLLPPVAGDSSLVLQMVPDDAERKSSVTIRRYHQEASTLDEELEQLRYAVVLKLDGQILDQKRCRLAGLPGLRVTYLARPGAAQRKYMRYLLIRGDELITIHCVFHHPANDLHDFARVAETLSFSPIERVQE